MSGGLLWKIPWRLSKFQKARQRKRLRAVDSVVATVDRALAAKGITTKAVESIQCLIEKRRNIEREFTSYQNGQDYHKGSILPVIDMDILGWTQWQVFSPEDLVYNMH
ncbi:hypothetical protein DID88_009762 [Monilinia fructigena]|uniref:54S ribosomal protein L31, mitochondrial n=1 Tax=Monilinia fructigena TaxID=38457 RepID=A0A395IK61_9HELO|nr:hypothetical protein DID88_009762 [Monilinia fructigena]